jgi:hypothetical protein
MVTPSGNSVTTPLTLIVLRNLSRLSLYVTSMCMYIYMVNLLLFKIKQVIVNNKVFLYILYVV